MKTKKKLKKLWSTLIALVLLVGTLPTMTLAAGSATQTADFVSDPTAALALLNDAKTGTEDSTWDGGTKTLTLNGVNFETTAATAVKLPTRSTIVLTDGTANTITGGTIGSDDGYCIFSDGNLTIKGGLAGTGTLTVTGGNVAHDSYGIYTSHDLNITGGTVEAKGGTSTEQDSYGIFANDIIITGGKVEAEGGTADECSGGIDAETNLTISGTADVTAKGGIAQTYNSYGIYAYSYLTITGGKVEAESGAANNYSMAIYSDNDVIISGGTVKATGGSATNYDSIGIDAEDDMTISGGKVEAKGGNATNQDSIGIYAYYYMTISGGTVTAIGGTAGNYSYGVYDDVTRANINGGTLIAQATDSALNTAPNASSGTYRWRTSNSSDYSMFPGSPYTWDASHTYLEIRGDFTVTVTDGTASIAGTSITEAAKGTEVTLTANAAPSGKVFDKWVVESGSVTLADANNATTTFTMPAGAVSVKATYATAISSVAITGIDAPKSNAAFDTTASCTVTGVSSTAPTVTWDTSDSKAGYYKTHAASVTLTADAGYKFADSVDATVNGNPATSVTKNANGTLTVTYKFPATEKHNIELTFNTAVRDGDAVKNPTINSGYEVPLCVFVEDANKNGDFSDDKTLLFDKVLVEEYIAQPGIDMTLEEFIAALKDEGLDDVKTEYTGGYDYSLLAIIKHSEGIGFVGDEDSKLIDAIVKVNGEDITDKCTGGGSIDISHGSYVFSAAPNYTVTFDANGGTGTMADVTGVSGTYTLPANGFTAPEGKQFKCWSVNGTEKAVGDKIAVAADTTVKAVWETIPAATTEYEILDGINSNWTRNSDGSLSVKGSGALSKFVGVKVDGTLVDAKNYTVKEGSTIVTLKADYLNTLPAGRHTMEIVWIDGSANTTFTVNERSPQTGDNSSMALWFALLFVSGAGVLGTAGFGKKKKN